MRIIGIDPSLTSTGWAIIEKHGNKNSYIASGEIKPKKSDSFTEKIVCISENLCKIIDKYKPEVSVMEDSFVNNNPRTSLILGQARGAIILTLAQSSLYPEFYEPRFIKKAITGSGSADKEQVKKMLSLLFPSIQLSSYDAADALATALCYNTRIKL